MKDYSLLVKLINSDKELFKKYPKIVKSKVKGEELELPEELLGYNNLIDESKDIYVYDGHDLLGRRNILYYFSDKFGNKTNWVRQRHIFNDKGDVIKMERKEAFEDGRILNIDEVNISYLYNKGKKIASVCEDYCFGNKLYSYNQNGNIVWCNDITYNVLKQLQAISEIMQERSTHSIDESKEMLDSISKSDISNITEEMSKIIEKVIKQKNNHDEK